jgi:hypothetical protein
MRFRRQRRRGKIRPPARRLTSHDFKQPLANASRPAEISARGRRVLFFPFPRGGAERRAAPVVTAANRDRTTLCEAWSRTLRGALRLLALHRGGFGPGPALLDLDDRNRQAMQRASRSQVIVPGGRSRALPSLRLQAAAAGRHSLLRLRTASRRRPSMSRDARIIPSRACIFKLFPR